MKSLKQTNIEFIPLPKKAILPASLGEDDCTWLNDFVAFNSYWSNRSYPGYHEGIGLWLLSVVAARRVSFLHGGNRYTSLNFALLGRTGLTAKSTATRIGIDLLNTAGFGHLLLPDTITPQRLVSVMAQTLPKE
jgi:hypothetical protein